MTLDKLKANLAQLDKKGACHPERLESLLEKAGNEGKLRPDY
jgi:hypothetical protein